MVSLVMYHVRYQVTNNSVGHTDYCILYISVVMLYLIVVMVYASVRIWSRQLFGDTGLSGMVSHSFFSVPVASTEP